MKLAQRIISIIEYFFGRAPRRTPKSLSPGAELYQDQDGRWRRSAQRFAAKIALRKCR